MRPFKNSINAHTVAATLRRKHPHKAKQTGGNPKKKSLHIPPEYLGSFWEVQNAVRTLCKVYPSPGAARSVWALPQTSCNMVADTDHPAASETHDRDGLEADITEQTHRTIFDIVKSGEISEIEELIEKSGTEVLRFRDEWGYTPAHWAALDGNVEIMRLIVDRGAPFDLPCLGIQGPRPIHWACRKGHTAVVQVLLQAGVAVNAADFKGLTPLMTACMFGRTATAAYLLGMGALNHLVDINGDTAMHWAAYKGHADLIRLLMYSGAHLQNSDHFGSTPLHLACLSGNVTCVKLIAEKVLHACMNLTTNEMFNYKRYPYLRDRRGRYFNPFSRGPIFNLIEFFFCTPEEYEDDYNYEYI